jgi:hypothetical protein
MSDEERKIFLSNLDQELLEHGGHLEREISISQLIALVTSKQFQIRAMSPVFVWVTDSTGQLQTDSKLRAKIWKIKLDSRDEFGISALANYNND